MFLLVYKTQTKYTEKPPLFLRTEVILDKIKQLIPGSRKNKQKGSIQK